SCRASGTSGRASRPGVSSTSPRSWAGSPRPSPRNNSIRSQSSSEGRATKGLGAAVTPVAVEPGSSVVVDGVLLASLLPASRYFEPSPSGVVPGRAYVLSRFAYMRAHDGAMLLECPLSHARAVLHDWRATAVAHLLSRPRRVEEVSAQ